LKIKRESAFNGYQKIDDIEPTVYVQPSYVLKYPLKPGTSWADITSTAYLEQKVEDIQIIGKIEAIDDIVTVPAGTFENCIRIKYLGEKTVDMDKREGTGMKIFGKATITIEVYE
jgi:hypothetical protein